MYKFCGKCKKMVEIYRTTITKNFPAIDNKVKEEWIESSCQKCGLTIEVVVIPTLSL